MRFKLLKYLATSNYARSYFIVKTKFGGNLTTRSSLRGPFFPAFEAFKYYPIIRSFKTMECCGTGCGLNLSKEDLKKRLTSMQYQVTQEGDTERAFTGKYHNHFETGIYHCIVCNQDIFSSKAKFESKCGWPAFNDVVDEKNVKFKNDLSHDMKRTEVSCSKCAAHLGHVFDDGPKPTGKRYCINSAALNFTKAEETNTSDAPSKS